MSLTFTCIKLSFKKQWGIGRVYELKVLVEFHLFAVANLRAY